ncbi:hypothetical protein HFE03_07680 [Paenibacillus sp. EKM102P]|uniref:hypothetical protein n=1 Tax=unclassified Paenibacillus TaxID=185978 RepID=UPI00142E23F0|nr:MULTISPECIES: hypothetical protein [unclassified Paenibacillus]KAF6620523.1 hypothetical protein HFE00_05585 [Paenibacillus sp. EKM101P]KAF6623515.1 hypothetical protein HFE03_07680 [Paenibacillus sp. EKM102P]KAF6633921.1 hypothetical protein HFE01_06825 [Paenibacillus sp. EKM10P]KAF6649449.1 hypothetical protein HFE02_01790 [Paenibacillus sp. EKM11P]
MIQKIEIKTPKYETVQVGEDVETMWETSDGKQFESEGDAERHEFYQCKINHRGHNLPIQGLELFDFTCVEDLERYEKDYLYNEHVKKYDKKSMSFPNTYAMYEEDDPTFDYEDYDDYYNRPDKHIYFMTLEDYKNKLITAVKNFR